MFLGLMERDRDNLNWSATCSYYSLVHGGRLICFLALGDFPRRHERLRSLFSLTPDVAPARERFDDGFPFNWLRDFSRLIDRRLSPEPLAAIHSERELSLRQAITDYFEQLGLVEFGPRFDRFSRTLKAAAPLRNDSNYEALLIAHEYRHVQMTDAFKLLSDSMCSAAEVASPFINEVMVAFVNHDADLKPDRDAYQAFLYDYLRRRLVEGLSQKLADSPRLVEQLKGLVAAIVPTRPKVGYDSLEHAVSIDMFGPKAQLMWEFRERIGALKDAINQPEVRNGSWGA
jgi:hypothetical protein